MTNWNYESMYKWYTKQGKVRDSLYAIIYPIIYDSKRVSRKDRDKVEPFIKKNIIYVGESPIHDKNLYPNDLYLLYDDNYNNKQYLYFVYPTIKICGDNNVICFANHITFCYDKSDKRNSCHFHSTIYDCYGVDDYTYRHIKDYFPDKLQLTEEDEMTIIRDPFHKTQRSFILQLMKFPWKQIQYGSGRKKQKSKQDKPLNLPIRNKKFCDFWEENNIKSITMMGINDQDDNITFSISVLKKGRTYNNEIYRSFIYSCNKNDDYEKLLQEYISQQIL